MTVYAARKLIGDVLKNYIIKSLIINSAMSAIEVDGQHVLFTITIDAVDPRGPTIEDTYESLQ